MKVNEPAMFKVDDPESIGLLVAPVQFIFFTIAGTFIVTTWLDVEKELALK